MDEKENRPSERGTYSQEDIESAIATITHLKLMFEKGMSIDWQLGQAVVFKGTVGLATELHKAVIVDGLRKAIAILGGLQEKL